ncbi:hypothetical protein EMPS_02081 [Entomortierella parvispora]|uniref:DNA 3'-5' helicase n=1 Tax=Entomortierella parvispora TaxID=205924 RepID=A0A9P3H4S3_9FUNG|nr:hypothetical protein EMPS_02081 [Entomortierella parvispora]
MQWSFAGNQFGFRLKSEQLQVTKSIGHGKDIVLIAACGWGKSLVFFLPLLFWDRGVIVIVSPLRAVMKEQHGKLESLGIRSLCLLGGGDQSINPGEIAKLAAGVFRAVFMTPEVIFENDLVEELWSSPRWHYQLRAVVLDEAHCIHTWAKFRKNYSKLGLLRPRLPPHVAFVAMSATLPPHVLHTVKASLNLALNVPVINTGNDRPNVKLMVMRTHSPQAITLEFLLTDQRKTIVYFELIRDLHKAHKHLLNLSGPNGQFASYFAILSDEYKSDTMEKFRRGEVRVLFASDAVGMGCDISDVDCVIQFGVPDSVLSLVQRLGRAARSPDMQGYGIVYCTLKQQYAKHEDVQLNEFLATKTCRRQVLNNIFRNAPRVIAENCCDICKKDYHAAGLPPFTSRRNKPLPPIRKGELLDYEERAALGKALKKWRKGIYDEIVLTTFLQFKPEVLLSDDCIMKLIKRAPRILRAEDVKETLVGWSPWKPSHFKELSDLVQDTVRKTRSEVARLMSESWDH